MNMNKIGIVTFHLSENYGAMLQACALRNVFVKNGAETHIVNYRSSLENSKFPKNIVHCLWNLVRNCLGHKKRVAKAEKFRSIYMGLNESQVFSSIGEIPNIDSYNKFVVGSDQVWNYRITLDPVYRLSFAKKTQKKYSYAASIGANDFEGDSKKMFEESLRTFSGVSVREYSAVDALSKIGIKAEHVLDPTLLLNADEWKEILHLSAMNKDNKKYVFCYVLPGNPTSRTTVLLAKSFAKQNKLDLIVVGEREYMKLLSSNYRNDVGVDEFVELVKDSEMVVTNSFHGTCFSLIFHKSFLTTIASNISRNNRIVELLSGLNLKKQLVDINEYGNIEYDFPKIDYSEIDQKLTLFHRKSISYIKKIIDS